MTAEQLQSELEGLSPEALLAYLAARFPAGNVRFSTSLGQEDQVLTAMIFSQNLPIQVFTLDTGRMFQETYDLLDNTRARYGNAPVQVFFPESAAVEAMMTAKGTNSFYESVENRKECCRIRKVEPLKRALAGAEVWITGLRAAQSDNRASLPLVEYDPGFNILKVNPLLHWSLEEVVAYLAENRVPYNPLHDRGFVSIGCAPCTRAIEPGEHPRAGRWWWEDSHKECGLHK